ncbi:hypothetical protein, partial [Burkholderia sp. E168m23]|uniref:hypothetical protein n=2 Tax=Burkholderiaceae TaxID=119060 RepID=UPI0027D93B45
AGPIASQWRLRAAGRPGRRDVGGSRNGALATGTEADGPARRSGRILAGAGRPASRGIDRSSIDERGPRTTEITMNKLLPMTIALLAGSGIGAAPLHAAGAMDAPPCSAAHAADRAGGNGAMPGTSVRSFSTAGCSGAVLQGDRATATVDGDRIELRDGVVYVNGRSYGAVAPAQTVEYEAARDRRTLKVDGKVRTPQR